MAGEMTTTARVIDGKAFAAGLRAHIGDAVPAFAAATGRVPGLAVVLVVALAGFVSWRFREARSGRPDQSSSASGPAAQSEPAE